MFVKQRLGRGESRKNVHAEVLGLLSHPCRQQTQRHNQIAVIVQMRPRRQPDAAVTGQQAELIARRRNTDAGWAVAPLRQQRIERSGLDDGAGQRVRTHRGTFFEHA